MIARPDTPRQAVILAAGLGSRLRPLTNTCPKPLVEVHGVPILHNALRQLDAVGVREATIVVGYRNEAIENSCGPRFGGVEITYVESPIFDRTGSAYSLWLARDALLSGAAFLLEGDVFFERMALFELLDNTAENVAAVAQFEVTMEGSAVLLAPDGMISDVRLRQTAADLCDVLSVRLFKTMNLFRFSAATLRDIVVPALDERVAAGATTIYTEQLLANLIKERGLRIAAARCEATKWYEIDSEADLRVAEGIFAHLRAPMRGGQLMRSRE